MNVKGAGTRNTCPLFTVLQIDSCRSKLLEQEYTSGVGEEEEEKEKEEEEEGCRMREKRRRE